MKNNDNLKDVVLNTSMVLEGIVRSPKLSKDEKIDLLCERLCNTLIDLLKIRNRRKPRKGNHGRNTER